VRKIGSHFLLALLIAGFFTLLPKSAAAQDDPPGRVARLNFTQGSISYQVSGDQDWVQADPNRPLTTGDNLWADKDSRGEVHIGSTAIRLSSETGISFLTLDDRTAQLQLAQGTIEVHLRNLAAGEAFEIDTPNLAFTLNRGGEYRISTDPNGSSTLITVREGEGEVTGAGDSWTLGAGQQYSFDGTDQLAYDAQPAPGFDDFEDWCQTRDQRENSAASAKYVSRDVDGYYDLDDYGEWDNDPDYGAVWIPRGVAAGWAPYQVGHWVYVAPWGWTWVDEEPWGFAPFHYGRWAYVGTRWGWVPGPLVVRPVYAPALVAFVGGGGGGFGFSVAFGGGFAGVAWFPLGPRDVFIPGYRASPRYVQNINITNTRAINVTQVTNVYNNRTEVNYTYARNDAAVTAVSRDTFVGARSVRGATVRVTADQIDHARVVDSAPIAPTRMSYVSANAKVSNAKPAVAFSQRPVVARLNPATPVDRRAPVAPNSANRPGPQQGFQSFGPRNGNGAGSPAPANNNGGQPQTREGFRSFQPPNQNNGSAGNADAVHNNANGSNNNAQPSRDNVNSAPGTDHGNNTIDRPSQTTPPAAQQQNQNQSQVRFAPPQKARDDMYDVHPALNNKSAPAPAPKQEKPKEQNNKKDDKKDDKK